MPSLELKLFGSFEILLDGNALSAQGTEKMRALLAYLALESTQPHSREHLAGLLWPDQPEKQAQHNFRQALSTLRKLLRDDENLQPFILLIGDSIQFNPQAVRIVDVDTFDNNLNEAFKYYSRRTNPGRVNLPLLKYALEQYRGPFLAQFGLAESSAFDEWTILQRERCNQRAIQALALLADYHERREEFLLARQTAEKLVELAPWDETAHLQVVRLLAQDGQWSLAQARYQSLRRQLQEQMGLEPSAETNALFEEMRHQQPFPPRFDPPKHNLRLPPGPFIGRSAEIGQLSALLANPDNRLITLLGVGGIGKTRLGIHFSYTQIGMFPDGVWYIPLSEDTLLPGLARALHFTPGGQGNLHSQLFMFLTHKNMLLLLDGFEHIQKEGQLLADLLAAAPGLTVLVTSRHKLDLHNEILFPVEGLEIPPEDIHGETSVEKYSAVALFLSRARRLRPELKLSPSENLALAQICRLLQGLPLGLELAAAAIWSHTPNEIAAEICRSLDFLTASYPDLPPRHRSLRAAFNYSWELLTPEMQTVFARLAVFRGSFFNTAGIAVTNCLPTLPGELLDRSLLRQTGDGRLEIPEPILPYALEQLETIPAQAKAMHTAHAEYYAALFASQETVLSGQGMLEGIALLLPELANAQQAWGWAIAFSRIDLLEIMLEPIHQLLYTRSAFQEAISLFEAALPLAHSQPDGQLFFVRLLIRLGLHNLRIGNMDQAQEALQQGLNSARQLANPKETILALSYLSNLFKKRGQKKQADQAAQEMLRLSEETGNSIGIKNALYLLGENEFKAGNFSQARQHMQKSLEIARQIGNPLGILTPLNSLGDYACQEERYTDAARIFAECLQISRALGSQFHISLHLNNLGTVHHMLKDYAQAQACYRESCKFCFNIGDQEGEAVALCNLGEIDLIQGNHDLALENYTKALNIAHKTQSTWIMSIAWNNIGKTHHMLHNLPAAWENLQKGLQTAFADENIPQVMKSLTSMGTLLLEERQNNAGKQVLALVFSHPASEPDDRKQAAQHLSPPTPPIPTLEEIVLQLLHLHYPFS